MMWESGPWKEELRRTVARLERRSRQKQWREASYARVELDAMQGFYMVRKLIEAPGKVSETVKNRRVPVTEFDLRPGAQVDSMNWHKITSLYDLDAGKAGVRDLMFVCNQFVHSFVFVTAHGNDPALTGFYLASDRQKEKTLLLVTLADVLKCFAVVASDYPANLTRTVDSTGKEIVTATGGVLDDLNFTPGNDLR